MWVLVGGAGSSLRPLQVATADSVCNRAVFTRRSLESSRQEPIPTSDPGVVGAWSDGSSC